jgi:hypothetical protein
MTQKVIGCPNRINAMKTANYESFFGKFFYSYGL